MISSMRLKTILESDDPWSTFLLGYYTGSIWNHDIEGIKHEMFMLCISLGSPITCLPTCPSIVQVDALSTPPSCEWTCSSTRVACTLVSIMYPHCPNLISTANVIIFSFYPLQLHHRQLHPSKKILRRHFVLNQFTLPIESSCPCAPQ